MAGSWKPRIRKWLVFVVLLIAIPVKAETLAQRRQRIQAGGYGLSIAQSSAHSSHTRLVYKKKGKVVSHPVALQLMPKGQAVAAEPQLPMTPVQAPPAKAALPLVPVKTPPKRSLSGGNQSKQPIRRQALLLE